MSVLMGFSLLLRMRHYSVLVSSGVGVQSQLNIITISGDRGLAAPNLNTASGWAHSYINQAFDLGLVPISLQNNYRNHTTRAEFAALAVALYEKVTGKEIEVGPNPFTDTNDMNARKAAAVDVTRGTNTDGTRFSPNDPLTREQAATMLARLAAAIGKPLPVHTSTFADRGLMSSWATTAVGQVQGSSIMNGVSETRFAPRDPYSRERA